MRNDASAGKCFQVGGYDENFRRFIELVIEPQPIARRVSIEIGEGNSRVMVTIHERAGDVSLKFHSAAEPLRAALQASVGSLVETLKRGEVPLANMDFRSGFAGNSDSSPRREKRPNAARRARPAAPDDTAEVDSISGKDTINIRG